MFICNVPIHQRRYLDDALSWDFLAHIAHHLNHRSLAIQHQLMD